MSDAPGAERAFRRVLFRLFLIQFFSWSAMFALWIYALPVVAGIIGADGSWAEGLGASRVLVIVSLCFAGYALLGACASFALPGLIARWGHGLTYGLALLTGALGLALLGMAGSTAVLAPAFVLIGLGWSAMGSLPYALVSKLAPKGRGAHFTRLFSFSTVVPQAVTTLLLALFAAPWFGAALGRVVLCGAGAMALAGLIALASRGAFAPADAVLDDW